VSVNLWCGKLAADDCCFAYGESKSQVVRRRIKKRGEGFEKHVRARRIVHFVVVHAILSSRDISREGSEE